MRVERANSRMASLGFPLPAGGAGDELAPELAALLAAGFDEMDGCVVLRAFHHSATRTSVAKCHDETGFEAFINHVHIEDYLPDGTGEDDALMQASDFVRQLADQLAASYPDREFHVIVGISDSCTVRFHAERPGQAWLADDIEGYEREAVMSISTCS